MDQSYTHLSREERDSIYLGLAQGRSARMIAKQLGRSPATIYREMNRNKTGLGYLPDTAQAAYIKRRWRGFKLARYPALRSTVIDHLLMGWSPDVIAGVMRRKGRSGAQYACAETIYRYLYSSSFARKFGLTCLLPTQRLRRKKRRTPKSKSRIPGRVSIHQRPASAMNRSRFGHWEGDLILFTKQRDNIITTQERKSRLIKAKLNPSKEKDITMKNLSKIMKTIPKKWRKSITVDNGGEFAAHQKLHDEGIQTFFCDPYSSWQKGGLEHANGMLRRFLPRSTNLKNITQDNLDDICEHINNIPRKILNYQSPKEIFNRRTSF